MVIVCGSANSWIQDKLINNHGGLYNRLFASVFVNPEVVKNIVQLLYIRNAGFTRAEIVKKLGITDGGRLSRYLNASISSWRGFAFENSW